MVVRPARAAAVKDGSILEPPEGLVLDGREYGGSLVGVGIGDPRLCRPMNEDRDPRLDVVWLFFLVIDKFSLERRFGVLHENGSCKYPSDDLGL